MRILQITNRIPFPLNDGGNIATYNLAKELRLAGHQVHMLSLNTNKHYQDPKVMEQVVDKIQCVNINTDVKPVLAIRYFLHEIPYNIQRFMSAEFEQLIKNEIEIYQPDIIQIEGSFLGIYVAAIRSITNVPVILRAHNVEFEIWSRLSFNEKNWFKKQYLQHLSSQIENFERKIVSQFSGIIAITNKDLNFFNQVAPDIPQIDLPSGMYFNEDYNGQDTANTIGFLGSLEWLPNIEGLDWFLNNCWPKIHKMHKSSSFHYAGKNPPEKYNNIDIGGTKFYGMVENAEDFIAPLSIIVVPLFSGSGLRIKILEAMALGKCVVTTAIGCEGIDAIHQQEIVIATPENYAETILNLLNHPDEIRRIGANAKEFARIKYDWKKLVHNFTHFYKQLQ